MQNILNALFRIQMQWLWTKSGSGSRKAKITFKKEKKVHKFHALTCWICWSAWGTEYIFYRKSNPISLRLPKYWPPNSPFRPASLSSPRNKGGGGGVHTHRAERWMGGSIFWKTREIGLPSYSKICTLWLEASPVVWRHSWLPRNKYIAILI